MFIGAPKSTEELMQRVTEIAGLTLAELAASLANQSTTIFPNNDNGQSTIAIPENTVYAKGWTGQLIEAALGASASSKPLPDFPDLGIELKTIPVNSHALPIESTYVCVAPVSGPTGDWEQSLVFKKTNKVLWIPIQGKDSQHPDELALRQIGLGFLWQPNDKQAELLRIDWEEHMERISLGKLAYITAKEGKVLQIRPKAANSSVSTSILDDTGHFTKTVPRGFYLRTSFTSKILTRIMH